MLRGQVVPLLPADLREEALGRIETLALIDTPALALNHGDLGSSNIHWEGGRVVGVLDWDLAAADDPAEDVASTAGSFASWDSLAQLLDADTIQRAHAFRQTFPLQIVAFAVQHKRPAAEVDRALGRAVRALRAEPQRRRRSIR